MKKLILSLFYLQLENFFLVLFKSLLKRKTFNDYRSFLLFFLKEKLLYTRFCLKSLKIQNFQVVIGFTAGTAASCLNIPFDVAKSRIQGPQGTIHYNGTITTLSIVYRREGYDKHFFFFFFQLK